MPIRNDGTGAGTGCRSRKKNTGDMSGRKMGLGTKHPDQGGSNMGMKYGRYKRDGTGGVDTGMGYQI